MPERKKQNITKLSILMPVFNEEDNIASIIDRIDKVKFSQYNVEKELIIIDDASTDRTLEKIPDFDFIKVIYHNENMGKGSAVKTGIASAAGDIIIIQDADLEYYPEEYEMLIAPIIEKEARVVYGSRFKKRLIPERMRLIYLLFNWTISGIATILFFRRITDEATCYKVFDANLLRSIPLKSRRFEFCPEVTAKLLKRKIRIKELPISYTARSTKKGKKITWKDGVEAIYYLIKYRFTD